MALRDYRPDYYPYEDSHPKETQATFQEYKVKNQHHERLKEILFFMNISIFSVITVIATYIYLSLNVPTFFAFVLAILTGVSGLKLVQLGMRTQYKHMKSKKRLK